MSRENLEKSLSKYSTKKLGIKFIELFEKIEKYLDPQKEQEQLEVITNILYNRNCRDTLGIYRKINYDLEKAVKDENFFKIEILKKAKEHCYRRVL